MPDGQDDKPEADAKPVQPVKVPEQKPTLRWLRPEDIRRALADRK